MPEFTNRTRKKYVFKIHSNFLKISKKRHIHGAVCRIGSYNRHIHGAMCHIGSYNRHIHGAVCRIGSYNRHIHGDVCRIGSYNICEYYSHALYCVTRRKKYNVEGHISIVSNLNML